MASLSSPTSISSDQIDIRFINARLLLPRGNTIRGSLTVRGGRITEIIQENTTSTSSSTSSSSTPTSTTIDCKGKYLSPGFLDVQCNGGNGIDFSDDNLTLEDIFTVSERLLCTGVTAICPTIISTSKHIYEKNLVMFAQARELLETTTTTTSTTTTPTTLSSNLRRPVGRLLGVHLEGPYLHSEKRGAHDAKYLRIPQTVCNTVRVDSNSGGNGSDSVETTTNASLALDATYGTNLLSPTTMTMATTTSTSSSSSSSSTETLSLISMITLAPELPGSTSIIQHITDSSSSGIVASIGHTTATLAQARDAVAAGATMITHLFNAMPPLSHREPGVVGLLGEARRQKENSSSSMMNREEKNTRRNVILTAHGASKSTAVVTPFTQFAFLKRLTPLPVPAAPATTTTSSTLSTPIIPYFGLIADNIHVHPNVLSFAYRSNPTKCINVTDQARVTGLPPGKYSNDTLSLEIYTGAGPGDGFYKGPHVIVAGSNGTLAGAVCSLDACLRNFISATGCSVAEAAATVTAHPARMLGLLHDDREAEEEEEGVPTIATAAEEATTSSDISSATGGGSSCTGAVPIGALIPGAVADLVILDDDLNVVATYLSGQRVWGRYKADE